VQLGKNNNWDDAKIKEKSPFRVAEPGMTFTLLRAQRDLLKIGQMLGRDTEQIEKDITILEGGVQSLWNPDLFLMLRFSVGMLAFNQILCVRH